MKKEVQGYDISQREHNWMEVITEEIDVAAAADSVTLSAVSERLKENVTYGLMVRMQRTAAFITANAGTERTSFSGTNLLNRTAMGTAHLEIKIGGTSIIQKVPLEVLAFDPEIHQPGSYAQFVLPEGIDFKNSKITLDGSKVTSAEVIELTFLPAIERCRVKKTC